MMSTTIKALGRSLMTLALGTFLAAGATTATAKQSRHRATLSDVSEARDNRRELADDRADQQRLEQLVDDWRRAYRHGNEVGMRAADRGLRNWIVQELGDDRRDVTEAASEVRDSRGEVRTDSRTRSYGNSHPRGVTKGQVREARDDRRDLRDDRSDLRTERRDYGNTWSIASELIRIQMRMDLRMASRADYERKNQLLGELLQAARTEVVADRAEIREDRGERREDRRSKRR